MKLKKLKSILFNHQIQAAVFLFLFVLITISACMSISLFKSFKPQSYSSSDNIDDCYLSGARYVNVNADTLYYTGYDYLDHDRVKGHYYYTLADDRCTIYLISTKYFNKDNIKILDIGTGSGCIAITLNKLLNSCDITGIDDVSFKAVLKKNDTYLKPLLEYMAIDLNWNYSGLSSHTSAIMISQYHYSLPLYLCLLIITFIGIISLVFYIVKYFKTLKKTVRK